MAKYPIKMLKDEEGTPFVPLVSTEALRTPEGETIEEAAIRECHEELGKNAIFDESKFTFLMDFDEIASSDNKTKIHFYLFIYNGNLEGKLEESDEM